MPEPLPFESVFAQSPVGEYLLSPSDDPVILAVNDSFLRAAGRSRESLVGQRLFDAFPGDPDDTGDTGLAALRGSLARVLATRRADPLPLQRYPIRVTRADGSEGYEERYWRAVSAPIVDAGGRIVCIAHRTEDVTEQARVAEALRHSTDRQRFQLEVADRLRPLTSPGEIATTASAMLGRRFGITRVTYVEVDAPSGTFVQRHWASDGAAPPPAERRRLDDFGPEIVATLQAGRAVVIEDVCSDPRTRAHAQAYAGIGVRASLAIPLVKSGRLSLVLSLQHDAPRRWSPNEIELASDVAERTWAAAENARAQEALREANRRKDEFLAMLAHELRNPLAPIRVAADLLARNRLDEAQLHKTSAIIARQVQHMTGLVDDLLDVSRVTRGRIALDTAPQDLKTVVAHAVEQARPLMESQRHRLTLELPPVDAIVSGDEKRLVQVVSNLLTNAAKYTPPGGHVRVAVVAEHDRVQVRVEDDGIGIPQELQPLVFELFVQAEQAADRAQGGLGLGLPLVRSLVALHDGTVSVQSAGAGAGSTFTVTLPRLAAGAVAGAAPAPTAPPPPGRVLDVLILDDNADAAEMLRLLLETHGHRVRVEHDPLRALQAAAERPPQVGFIDIGLPAMDGCEVVRRLRAAPGAAARATYIALTGYGQAADRAAALQAGFDEHLVKPADPQRLLALLEAHGRPAGEAG